MSGIAHSMVIEWIPILGSEPTGLHPTPIVPDFRKLPVDRLRAVPSFPFWVYQVVDPRLNILALDLLNRFAARSVELIDRGHSLIERTLFQAGMRLPVFQVR